MFSVSGSPPLPAAAAAAAWRHDSTSRRLARILHGTGAAALAVLLHFVVYAYGNELLREIVPLDRHIYNYGVDRG
ncbi:unnamed protein product [Urochloa humidicola]